MTSWRTASVALLSFSSGLPLGVIWIAIPDWMRSSGIDIRVVGLITLAQAPWTFKFLWSPLMDRFRLPWLGRRRGWIALAQLALFALTLGLAGLGDHPEAPWVLGALAFAIALASATHDIAYDAYTVDVLRPEEQGVAVGAKTALYMTAFRAVGGLGIAVAGRYSWPLVNVCLALTYLPMLGITWAAPEPPVAPVPPRTLREAAWLPFLGFLARHRALEILAFVFFYKFADNLAVALVRPFLVDMGYSDFDRGVVVTTVGWIAIVAGAVLGGILTGTIGLGHSLWIFGFIQIFSNLGYVLVARAGVDRPLMYGAIGFDNLAQGLGSGAFTVLLLRLTQTRFSATQYALFSSLFGLPRVVTGPITGYTVAAVGWEAFFWATLLAGIPGMILLHRFAPLGTRDPHIDVEAPKRREPLARGALWGRGVGGGIAGAMVAAVLAAALAALPGRGSDGAFELDLPRRLAALVHPADVKGWLRVAGVLVFGALSGLVTAAVAVVRSRAGPASAGVETASRGR